ncbi:MAG: efflux RND transporter periplasmic adaptor subunit [Firmicutes bacterium]|nr:efflux RND transporter periplasmic adaptor subunit [Bacillota bacterium]
MNARQFLLNLVVVVVLLAIGGGVAYQVYEANNYVSTDNAQVSVPQVSVDALGAGTVTAVDVGVGQKVNAGSPLVVAQNAAAASRAAAPAARRAGAAKGASAAPAPSAQTPAAPATATITAPVAGVVTAVDVTPGQTVVPGQTLVVVSEPQNAMVVANVPETSIRNVEDGQAVDVTLDAYPGTVFTGHVAAIQPATQASLSLFPASALSGSFTKVTQLVPVWIRFDPQGYTLYNGLSAEVRIHTGSGAL